MNPTQTDDRWWQTGIDLYKLDRGGMRLGKEIIPRCPYTHDELIQRIRERANSLDYPTKGLDTFMRVVEAEADNRFALQSLANSLVQDFCLRGDELLDVMEWMPNFVRRITAGIGLGVDFPQMRRLASWGGLTPRVIVQSVIASEPEQEQAK